MTSSGHHSFYSSWNASARNVLEEMGIFFKIRSTRINFFENVHYALLLYSVSVKIRFYFTLQSERPVNSAGVLSQSSSIYTAPCCLSLLASTSLSLPLLNFVRDSLPSANTALLCILLPCMTSAQLFITSLYHLELATNHHLSLLAKIDHFILNTDGTWSVVYLSKEQTRQM